MDTRQCTAIPFRLQTDHEATAHPNVLVLAFLARPLDFKSDHNCCTPAPYPCTSFQTYRRRQYHPYIQYPRLLYVLIAMQRTKQEQGNLTKEESELYVKKESQVR
jgi:hypothetical protein